MIPGPILLIIILIIALPVIVGVWETLSTMFKR